MALPTKLFFKDNRKYGIGEISFDLIMAEDHTHQSDVTMHPVQDGSIISDHIQNKLKSGTVTGLISNYSINTRGLASDRSQDVFDALVALWEERTPVTITTIMRVYENVAITSMPLSRDQDSIESLTIQINFQEIKTVKLQEVVLELAVKVKDLDSNRNRRVSGKSKNGRSSTQQSKTPQWARDRFAIR